MTPQHRPRDARRATALWIGAGVIGFAGAAGWWLGQRNDDKTESPASASDPGVAHVHGLGINPADGSLIIATHFGSFELAPDSDSAERIGDSYQDTMGFTVAGPDHFFGSGHPDIPGFEAGQPARLGLIESTDGGETWASVSLSGQVDFHVLAVAGDRVYGWDSGTGRFMVPADRRTWETRSTVDIAAFAVDPGDADHVIAAGPSGLIESDDGGRTWAAEGDGPQLVALSWHDQAGLWGADPHGAVWRHDQSGWAEAGSVPGEPQALLATGDTLYLAAANADGVTGIYRSSDQGRSWELRYQDQPAG